MARIRKKHSPAFKAQVALEASRQAKTIAELAKQYQVHPVQISQWKKQLLDGIETLFQNGSAARQPDPEKIQAELDEQLGRLQMELAWVEKNLPREVVASRVLIDSKHAQLSIRRQCESLGLDRSSFDYEPATETIDNLRRMRRIDEQYLKTPSFGSRRMAAWLSREGEEVNRKRVKRLMGLMGLEAIHPGPRTTVRNPDHKVDPYLLRGVRIERQDHVWSSDITYIPMDHGFMYLTAVIDWYSRPVLSWSLSNSLDGRSCLETLEEALRGGRPEIFNTDQGVQ
jgi:putative transposase